MKVGTKINIWIARDDSGYASELFGVEPQNDWYDIQYYPEQIKAIVIWNKGLLLAQETYISNGLEFRGQVFDISRNGIRKRIEEITNTLNNYGKTLEYFLEDVDEKTLDFFFKIQILNK